MTDPRLLTLGKDGWLTDSRVYSLIWMGRWLERAEGLTRAVDAAALIGLREGGDPKVFQSALTTVAAAWGITPTSQGYLSSLLQEDSGSSVYNSLAKARVNAHQVGPLELINAINAVVLLAEQHASTAGDPEAVHKLATEILDGVATVSKVIEDRWFHREALSEEEVYQRFIQQQQ